MPSWVKVNRFPQSRKMYRTSASMDSVCAMMRNSGCSRDKVKNESPAVSKTRLLRKSSPADVEDVCGETRAM